MTWHASRLQDYFCPQLILALTTVITSALCIFSNTPAIVLINELCVCVVYLYTADYVSVHIFVSSEFGTHVGTLVDNGTRVFMHISIGRHHTTYYSTINKTSMLFLSISFIVLMIISLAWLVFYYVQRSRYTYAKQRLSVIVCCRLGISLAGIYLFSLM